MVQKLARGQAGVPHEYSQLILHKKHHSLDPFGKNPASGQFKLEETFGTSLFYDCKMLIKEMFQYLPDNWPWLLLGAILAYLCFWILKFIQHRRFYRDLVSLKEPSPFVKLAIYRIL